MRLLCTAFRSLDRNSLLLKKQFPDETQWDLKEHFIVDMLDQLNRLVWLNNLIFCATAGKQAKNALKDPPKPIPRPGDEKKSKKKIRFGNAKDFQSIVPNAIIEAKGD